MLAGLGRLISALNKQKIDVYEWQQSDVRKVRLANGPLWGDLATKHLPLQFTGWQLAHAVAKTDFLIERDFLLPGLGLLLQVDSILDFTGSTGITTVPGATASLNDFTRTSLSGRLGQGLSMLFAHSQGFKFVGHLTSDPVVAAHLGTLGKQMRAADFLFEKQNSERMILESKATFTQLDNDPTDIKRVLKAALIGQVDYWMDKVSPMASKGYAVLSCLRETGSSTPSALVFVDPAGEGDTGGFDLPESWVRRQNYAAWISVMGFPDAARAMREARVRDGLIVNLPVFQIGDRQIAVSTLGRSPKDWTGAGLEIGALKAVGAALAGREDDLMRLEGELTDGAALAAAPYANGSLFPDGSWFGELNEKTQFIGNATFSL